MIRKKLLIIIVGALLLTVAQLAAATEEESIGLETEQYVAHEKPAPRNSIAGFKPGVYLGAQFFPRFFAGYNFNPYFSLELGYSKIAFPFIFVMASLDIFDFSAKANFPLEKLWSKLTGWNMFLKAGPALVIGNYTTHLFEIEDSGRSVGVVPRVEAGFGYNFENGFSLDFSVANLGAYIGLSFRF